VRYTRTTYFESNMLFLFRPHHLRPPCSRFRCNGSEGISANKTVLRHHPPGSLRPIHDNESWKALRRRSCKNTAGKHRGRNTCVRESTVRYLENSPLASDPNGCCRQPYKYNSKKYYLKMTKFRTHSSSVQDRSLHSSRSCTPCIH